MRVIMHILIIMSTEYCRLYCSCFHYKLYYTCEVILWPLLACFPCMHVHAFTPCFHCMQVVTMRVIVHILIIMSTEYCRLYCSCFHYKLYYTCEVILWPLLACFPCIHVHAFTPCFHCMQVVSMRVIVHIRIIMCTEYCRLYCSCFHYKL